MNPRAVTILVPLTAGLSEDLAVPTPHHTPMARDMGDRDSCGQEALSKWIAEIFTHQHQEYF